MLCSALLLLMAQQPVDARPLLEAMLNKSCDHYGVLPIMQMPVGNNIKITLFLRNHDTKPKLLIYYDHENMIPICQLFDCVCKGILPTAYDQLVNAYLNNIFYCREV